jgi:putative NADPH-quinone reductase
VFDLKWQEQSTENPLAGKEVVVLVTTNYQQEQFGEQGHFQYSIEELISGLFVVLKQNKLHLKDFLCIYDIDQMDKKEIIKQKQHFMSILNAE